MEFRQQQNFGMNYLHSSDTEDKSNVSFIWEKKSFGHKEKH